MVYCGSEQYDKSDTDEEGNNKYDDIQTDIQWREWWW